MSSESHTRGRVVPGHGPQDRLSPSPIHALPLSFHAPSPSNRLAAHTLGKAGTASLGPSSTTSQPLGASVFSSAKLGEHKPLCDTALLPTVSATVLLQTHHHPHHDPQAHSWQRAPGCMQHLCLKRLCLEGRPAAQPWEHPAALRMQRLPHLTPELMKSPQQKGPDTQT